MPPTRRIGLEMREAIVRWYYDYNWSIDECAHASGRCRRSIYNILGLYDTFGTPQNLLACRTGRRRSLTDQDHNFIVGLVRARPTIYLDEIQLMLEEQCDVSVSVATLSRTLFRLSLSNKSVARQASERDELLRAIWQGEWGVYNADNYVWIDESSVDDTATLRLNGWAPYNVACVKRNLFCRGVRYSMLPALTSEGMAALDIFEGSVDRERFLRFIREQVVRT